MCRTLKMVSVKHDTSLLLDVYEAVTKNDIME